VNSNASFQLPKATIPSFLTEDLQDAPEAQLPQGGQGEGFDDALFHASICSSAVSAKHVDLDIRARELDATLCNTLVANIKGSLQAKFVGWRHVLVVRPSDDHPRSSHQGSGTKSGLGDTQN